jgi:hypothetical protein
MDLSACPGTDLSLMYKLRVTSRCPAEVSHCRAKSMIQTTSDGENVGGCIVKSGYLIVR